MARYNICPNPGLKVNATNYFGGGARVTGATGLPLTTAYENTGTGTTCPRGTVTAGLTYRYSAYIKGNGGASTGNANINWYSAGAFLSTSNGPTFTVADGQVKRIDTGAMTAPATADQGLLNITGLDAGTQVTALLYEQTSLLGPYFDGDTAGAAWDGTSGNSTSTLTEGGTPGGDGTSDEAALRHGWGTPVAQDLFGYTGDPDPAQWGVYGNGGSVGGNECWVGHVGNGRRCVANATVGSGLLTINGESNGDTTGIKHYYDQKYGRWEVRMRAYATGGSGEQYHPVLLIWPSTEDWPDDGEYDFVENDIGDTTLGAFLHYPHPNLPVQQEHATKSGTAIGDWHNYAFEWSADFIRGFVDGVQWFSFTGGAGPAGRRAIQTMPSGTLRIQLDNFGGSPHKTANMEIDWVKVYTINSVPTSQEVTATSLASGAAFGSVILSPGGTIVPSGLESSAAFGAVDVDGLNGADFLGGRLSVHVAWGADLDADDATWAWTDITQHVRSESGIQTELGRADEASTSQPANCSLVLDNRSGNYSLGGRSINWPYVRRNTPVRVTVDPSSGQRSVLFFGFADGFTPAWDSLNGDIPIVTLSASGTLRRLQQGNSPVQSAIRRAMIATDSVVAYWPFEEGKGAQFAANFRGGGDMSYTGEVNWGADSSFECSAPLPTLKDCRFNGEVFPYTATGENQVRFLLKIPDSGLTDGTVLAYIYTTGSLLRWDLVYSSSGTGNLGFYIYGDDHALFDSVPSIGFDMNGNDRRVSIELVQNGANVIWTLGVADQDTGGAGLYSKTIIGETVGVVSNIDLAPSGDCDGVVFGHVTVQNDQTSLTEAIGPFRAFVGETTRLRLQRLAAENEVTLTTNAILGETATGADQMGSQLVAPLLDLLRECEAADHGQLYDGTHNGLTYTTRRYREMGYVALTIDAASAELFAPFQPADDDQRNRNRVSVTRTGGVNATYTDETGPLGTAAIGIYDESLTINNKNDSSAIQQAAWAVHLGTVEGYRYPSVTLNLRSSPELMADVLEVFPGCRIVVNNLDDTLAGFPEDSVSLIVEGISHHITPREWTVTFQCSMFSPWGVARIAAETGDTSEFAWRLDTDGARLTAGYAAGATSISVATPSGPLWTTRTDDYPLNLNVGGIKVVATACSGSSSPQTFTVTSLPFARVINSPVKLWDPRPIGL